jgi:hypothetical protein
MLLALIVGSLSALAYFVASLSGLLNLIALPLTLLSDQGSTGRDVLAVVILAFTVGALAVPASSSMLVQVNGCFALRELCISDTTKTATAIQGSMVVISIASAAYCSL